jgi:hypothetical protein
MNQVKQADTGVWLPALIALLSEVLLENKLKKLR